MPVEAVTLQAHAVEQATEFVGTVKSRRSTTVQPQVEGFVTRILVRSGDRVQPGTALMQIDPRMQQAAVANLESLRASREAALRYAQQDAARTKKLYAAGAASQSELEQAQTALSAAEAQLKATEAQINEQQVALGYHTVSAPTAGVVGDIPVRVGDRVTRTTPLTTIDQNAGLEVYINVPVQEAEHLKVGLPVHLVDDEGRLLTTTTLSFVSPSVDAGTQSVLVKAIARAAERPAHRAVRPRARGLDRDAGAHGSVRLRDPDQRPVLRLRGRARGGRKDRGAPAPARARGGGRQRLRREVGPEAGRAADRGRDPEDRRRRARHGSRHRRPRPRPRRRARRARSLISDAFIRRPILATVCSLLIILAGAICIPLLPIARYPQLTPPSVVVTAFYTGANAQAVESAVTTPIEQVVNGVEGMTYITSSSTNSGVSTVTVFFDIARDPDLAAVDVQNRVNQVMGRLPAEVRNTGVTVTKAASGFMGGLGFFSKDNRYSSQFISNYLDVYVRDALKRVPGRRQRADLRRAQVRDAAVARPRPARGARASPPATWCGRCASRTCRWPPGALGDAPADADQMYNLSVRALGRLSEVPQFENIVVKAGAGTSLVRVRDVGRVELGAETYSANLRFIGLEASGMGIQLLPSANALAVYQGVMKEMARLEKVLPARPRVAARLRQRGRRARVDQGGAVHAASRRSCS